MLINEENVVLKARVEMRFQSKLDNDSVVVTVDMSVNAIQPFKELTDQDRKSLWERDALLDFLARGSTVVQVDAPILLGNIDSLSILLWTHAIRCSTYCGAGIFVGRLKFSESCHKYSNLYVVSGE